MVKSQQAVALGAVLALSLTLWAEDKKYEYVQKYAEMVQKIGLPIQEAINKVMEEYGGIPISASLEMSEDEEGGFVFWVEIVRPTKDGKAASIWGISIDAETGELLSMENVTREKEREFREREKDREKERQKRLKEEEKERKREKEE